MKLKLDENLGERGRRSLQAAGHDVSTVPSQMLQLQSLEKQLWIVEPNRVRVYLPERRPRRCRCPT